MKERIVKLGILTLILMAFSVSQVKAEDVVVKILAPWQAHGEVYKIAPNKVKVVGSFDGIMYIDNNTGDLDAALFMCPGEQYIDLTTKKVEIKADCLITKGDNKVAYATLEAKGIMGAASGTFKIIGGEKKWRGISGSGKVIIRTALGQTALHKKSGSVINAAAGLAVWPSLKVHLPR